MISPRTEIRSKLVKESIKGCFALGRHNKPKLELVAAIKAAWNEIPIKTLTNLVIYKKNYLILSKGGGNDRSIGVILLLID